MRMWAVGCGPAQGLGKLLPFSGQACSNPGPALRAQPARGVTQLAPPSTGSSVALSLVSRLLVSYIFCQLNTNFVLLGKRES